MVRLAKIDSLIVFCCLNCCADQDTREYTGEPSNMKDIFKELCEMMKLSTGSFLVLGGAARLWGTRPRDTTSSSRGTA